MADPSAKIRLALAQLRLESPEIETERVGAAVIVTIVSRSFSGMDEGERQRRVWQVLRDNLDERDLLSVEFVFTSTPEEAAEQPL